MPAIMFKEQVQMLESRSRCSPCHAAFNRGIKVAPFKPQNMSNNAAVTEDGGEIGRAQTSKQCACNLQFLRI